MLKYSDILYDSYFHLDFGQSLVHVTSPAKLNTAVLNIVLKSSSGLAWLWSKHTSYQHSFREPQPAD